MADGARGETSSPPILLVTDLDDTLVGDDAATVAFRNWWSARPRGRLVYNTGRALPQYRRLLREKHHLLPAPDAVVLGVGTMVLHPTADGSLEEDLAYRRLLQHGWDRAAMEAAAAALIRSHGADGGVFMQPAEEQNDHKMTVGAREDLVPTVVAAIEEALTAGGLRAAVIVSGVDGWRFVDVVSAQAGKRAALEYVMRGQGFDPSCTVAAGDSGNDLLMLQGEHSAIVVSNAHDVLKEYAADHPGRVVVSTQPRALGILEGLEQLGFA